MFLERIEIKNYRGISRMSAAFNKKTVFIGENSWGKTSLLRGLASLLGNGDIPYEFTEEDFHKDYQEYREEYRRGEAAPRERQLSFVLTFREGHLGSAMSTMKLSRLKPCWVRGKDSFCRVYYYAGATMNANGTIFTTHGFLDRNGVLMNMNTMRQVRCLLGLSPVFRIRDSRQVAITDRADVPVPDDGDPLASPAASQEKLMELFRAVSTTDGEVIPVKTVREGIDAINILFEHYFSFIPPLMGKRTGRRRRTLNEIVARPISNESLGSLKKLIRNSSPREVRILLGYIAGSLLDATGGRRIDRLAKPIVIFEDIESRLHPTVLFNVWNILDLLPMQQIITTNSGDILTTVSLEDIRRCARKSDMTCCHQVDERKFTSDDLRKIAFHIRLNRPMTLFARSWVFVEGETEIWLLNEFASILGISLPAEGVRLVEYAQCGAAPLIKLASQLGIVWHLIADGDEAGIKYASQASHAGGGNQVTLLPCSDIEHFLFENGFEEVYRKASRLTGRSETEGRIIEVALKKMTKPGMALAIVDEARKRGRKAVPPLLQKLFAQIIARTVS